MLFGEQRPGIGRTVWIIVIIVILAVVAAIEYEVGLGSTSKNGTREIDLQIIEDNPVLQIDHFYPGKLYVPLGQNISLAVLNTDDETRVYTLSQFNVNLTISSGSTQRISFTANKLGNFSFISPVTPPSPVSQGRPGKCLEGFFVVTQNTTLITSTTSTSGSGAPGSTYCPNPLVNPQG